jgi:hypothetical protein
MKQEPNWAALGISEPHYNDLGPAVVWHLEVPKIVQLPRLPDETWVDHMKRENAAVEVLPLEKLLELPETANAAGIYFLWLKGQIQYVGKSMEIGNRLNSHHWAAAYAWCSPGSKRKVIPHDKTSCIVVATGWHYPRELNDRLRPLERAYIAQYQPPFNFLGQNPGT